jgi:hypothetical protein
MTFREIMPDAPTTQCPPLSAKGWAWLEMKCALGRVMTLGRVAHQKPLAQCGMEELAAYQRSIQPRNGVLFAQKADGEQKIAARQQVLDLFHPDR